jgi:Protein of unknown function (DUF3105)
MSQRESKKLQQKQARREAEEARRAALRASQRRSNLLTTGAAVLVGALVVGGIIAQRNAGDGAAVDQDVGVAESEAGCTDIDDPEQQPADHIEPGTSHAPYSSTPPTSGPHFPTPADTGFYTSALPPEQVVHNLEHGMIVIWYSPDAPQEIKDEIEELTEQETAATVALPFDEIEEPNNLVLTAWGHSQTCERVSQAVVDEFRSEFQGGGDAPEAELSPRFEG